MEETENALQACTEDEALRLARCLAPRIRELSFQALLLDAVLYGALIILLPLAAGALFGKGPRGWWLDIPAAMLAAFGLRLWLKNSPARRLLCADLDALAVAPWPSAHQMAANSCRAEFFASLLPFAPSLAEKLEAAWLDGSAPTMSERDRVGWLRHYRRKIGLSATETGLGVVLLREAGRNSETRIAANIVAWLAKPRSGDANRQEIVKAAREGLQAIHNRFPDR